jgi:hypothetical protein
MGGPFLMSFEGRRLRVPVASGKYIVSTAGCDDRRCHQAEGPFAEELVSYLLSIRLPDSGNTPIRFNHETGCHTWISASSERLMTLPAGCSAMIAEGKNWTLFDFRLTSVAHRATRQDAPLTCSPSCR